MKSANKLRISLRAGASAVPTKRHLMLGYTARDDSRGSRSRKSRGNVLLPLNPSHDPARLAFQPPELTETAPSYQGAHAVASLPKPQTHAADVYIVRRGRIAALGGQEVAKIEWGRWGPKGPPAITEVDEPPG